MKFLGKRNKQQTTPTPAVAPPPPPRPRPQITIHHDESWRMVIPSEAFAEDIAKALFGAPFPLGSTVLQSAQSHYNPTLGRHTSTLTFRKEIK